MESGRSSASSILAGYLDDIHPGPISLQEPDDSASILITADGFVTVDCCVAKFEEAEAERCGMGRLSLQWTILSHVGASLPGRLRCA